MRRAYIDLQFAPNWELIDPAREFLLRFLAQALGDPVAASQVSMAAHELLENAIKYSPNDEANVRIEVDSDGPVRLIVENEGLPTHIPVLMEELRMISEANDPAALYRQKMELAVTRSDGKCCLGLARIRCEAEMSLRGSVAGTRVMMIAERNTTPRPTTTTPTAPPKTAERTS